MGRGEEAWGWRIPCLAEHRGLQPSWDADQAPRASSSKGQTWGPLGCMEPTLILRASPPLTPPSHCP